MKTHNLKILPEHFKDVACGKRKHEFKFNDRDYKVGDELILNEWTDENGYTGLKLKFKITHILDDYAGLYTDYMILSIEPKDSRSNQMYVLDMLSKVKPT